MLENFDEEVVQKLKMRHIDDTKRVNTYNRTFWLLANSVLSDQVTEVDDDTMSFMLPNSPSPSIPNGKYILNKNSGDSHQLRIGHPLGEYIVNEACKAPATPLDICFRLNEHPIRKSLLEEQRGHSGVSYVYKVMSWNEHDSQEDIICCTKNDVGTCLPDDFVKALLQVVPESYRLTNMNDEANVSEELEAKLTKLKESLSERTNEYIVFEIDKFESWSEDVIFKLQEEVIALRKEHENIKRQIRKERVARVKLAMKEQEVKIARLLRVKQQELFDKQDDCDRQVDELTEKLRKSMENQTQVELMFCFKWTIQ